MSVVAYPQYGRLMRPWPASSTNGDHRVTAGDQLTDDGMTGELAGDEQPTGGLRIRQQEQLVVVDARGHMGSHPLEVASTAAGHEAGGVRLPGRLEVGNRRRVDDSRDSAGAAQLVEVAEQSEAGHVGGGDRSGGKGGPGGVRVQLGH